MPVQYNGTQRGRAATKNQYQNNHRGHEGNQCNSGRENLRSTRRISWIVVQRRTKAKTSYGGETKDTKEKQRKSSREKNISTISNTAAPPVSSIPRERILGEAVLRPVLAN